MPEALGRRWTDGLERVMVWKVAGVGRDHQSLRDPKSRCRQPTPFRPDGTEVCRLFKMACEKMVNNSRIAVMLYRR